MGVLDDIKGLVGDGDVAGFAKKFREKGLDKEVASWVSKGENLPIVGDQIEKVLGHEAVAGVAARLGVTHDEAADELAKEVPKAVDRLTPDGELPTAEQAKERVAALA